MSGFYPDGVTGLEPQIAGHSYAVIDLGECGANDIQAVESAWVVDEIRMKQAHLKSLAVNVTLGMLASNEVAGALTRMAESLADLESRIETGAFEVQVDDCPEPIKDEVAVDGLSYSVRCPRCGTEHFGDLPEPDDGR